MDLHEINPNLVYIGDTPECYRSAIIGISDDSNHVVYSYSKLIEAFIDGGMTEEEAAEWFDFNTARSLPYAGEYRPIVVMDDDEIEIGSEDED